MLPRSLTGLTRLELHGAFALTSMPQDWSVLTNLVSMRR